MALGIVIKSILGIRPVVCQQCKYADTKSIDDKGFMACCVDKPETAFDGKGFISGRPFTFKDAPACRFGKFRR